MRTLREAYQAHCDAMHILDLEELSYTEFLEREIEHLRVFAEPLRYAIRENPPREIDDITVIEVDKGRGSMDWLYGEPEIPLDIGYFKSLLHAIYDDHPGLKLPPYED